MTHRACTNEEHDPLNGKISGFCVICGVPFPCAYVGKAYGRVKNQPELMPCPCCGSAPKVEQIPPEQHNGGAYYIECDNPSCGITTRLQWGEKTDPVELLAEVWNRRSAFDDLKAMALRLGANGDIFGDDK